MKMKVTCPHSQIIQILFLINKSMPKCHFLIYIYIYIIYTHTCIPHVAIKMKRLAFICVVLTLVFTNTEACSCASRHPQTQFCNSDFGKDTVFFLKYS